MPKSVTVVYTIADSLFYKNNDQ